MEGAFRQVADKYGVNFETVRNWRKRLPKRDSVTHATIAVWEREAKQLRNMASRDGRPTEPSEAKPSASRFTGDRFGPEALERASSSYRTLIGSKQSGT
jgi:transposase-like protein